MILVDDGLATAARRGRQSRRSADEAPAASSCAVPVGARDGLAEIEAVADEVIALESPDWLGSIGEFYEDFGQTSDEDVVAMLAAAPGGASRGSAASRRELNPPGRPRASRF